MNKNKKNKLKTTPFQQENSLSLNQASHQASKTLTTWRIYLLIPNLIGYIRVLLVVLGFFICFQYPLWFVACYGLSQLLDALDGYAARYFRQSTRYGAMLDMVTDRASTAALSIALAKLYPAYTRLFMAVIVLDIVSHFAHIYSSLIYGKASHKLVSKNQNWLLRIYYSSRAILFLLCFGNEAYLLFLYLHYFAPILKLDLSAHWIIIFFNYSLACLFGVKQLINIIQLLQAAHDTVRFDQEEWIQRRSG